VADPGPRDGRYPNRDDALVPYRLQEGDRVNSDTRTAADLQESLGTLAQLIPPAVTAMDEVRTGLTACWPTRPSLRALEPADHELFASATRLAAGGRWESGELIVAIEAAQCMCQAHGHDPASLSVPHPWPYGRVDSGARLTPTPAANHALRAAISRAEDMRDAIFRQLDVIARLAPPETWLPNP
jgi:hypothetical protein